MIICNFITNIKRFSETAKLLDRNFTAFREKLRFSTSCANFSNVNRTGH